MSSVPSISTVPGLMGGGVASGKDCFLPTTMSRENGLVTDREFKTQS